MPEFTRPPFARFKQNYGLDTEESLKDRCEFSMERLQETIRSDEFNYLKRQEDEYENEHDDWWNSVRELYVVDLYFWTYVAEDLLRQRTESMIEESQTGEYTQHLTTDCTVLYSVAE